MKKLNPIWLWYSTILLFPPVHEWGHVLIAWAIGERVVGMHWTYIELGTVTNLDWIQDLWQYSPWVCCGCCLFSIYLILKEAQLLHVHTKVFCGVGQI
jgi:hypothetical protein